MTADSRAPRSAWRFAFLFGARHAKAFQNAYRSVFLSGVSVLGRTSVIAAFMAIPGAMLPCVAHAYHEGPTHAEVLGLDRKQHRIYFAQFDESEVAHAPVLSYFELRGTRPSFVIRVPGPLYLGDDPDGEMDRQIEELRLRLERPHALDSTKFTVRVRPTQLADSIFAVGTVDTVSRFSLFIRVEGLKRRGLVMETSYCSDDVKIVSALGSKDGDPVVVVLSYAGVLVEGCNDYERPALLTWPLNDKIRAFPR